MTCRTKGFKQYKNGSKEKPRTDKKNPAEVMDVRVLCFLSVVFCLFCLFYHAPRYSSIWNSGGITPHILNIRTIWRWVSASRPGRFSDGENVWVHDGGRQTRTQRGANGCTTPTTDLDAPTRNLQNIKDKHADQPAKDVPHLTASTCCLLNLRRCKQLTVKNVCICKVFCVMLYSALCN